MTTPPRVDPRDPSASATPSTTGPATAETPTFDLARLDASDPQTLEALHGALRDDGYIHLDARSVLDDAALATLLDEARAFFDLPAERKAALDLDRSPNYRGYVGLREEYTNGTADVKESFEFAPETTPPTVDGEAPPYFGLYGANQWPDPASTPGFRPALEAYSTGVTTIGRRMLRAIARTLDQPTTSPPGTGLFAGDLCSFSRLIYYAEAADTQGGAARLEAHTDHTLLTVILQSSPGLEVADGDGWRPVTAPSTTFVVFLGEMMEFWSRGYYRALPHRVYEAALSTERISVATFFLPDLRNVVAPLEPSASPRLAAADLSLSAENAWLTDERLRPIVVGDKEWQRMLDIFPEPPA